MNRDVVIAIAGAALATYLTRFPLMVLSGKKEIPRGLIRYMKYIAPAVLAALIAPAIFIREGRLDFSITNEYMISAAITALVAYFSKNMLAAVITGVCSVGILMYLL